MTQIAKTLLEMRDACMRTVTKTELDNQRFGLCLRSLREDSGKSLLVTAKALGVSAPFLSDCELGNRNLSIGKQLAFIEYCLTGKVKTFKSQVDLPVVYGKDPQ